MDAITYIAQSLNYIVNQVVFIVHMLFKLNHDCVSVIIDAFTHITDAVIKSTNFIVKILYCYFTDFIAFLDEFGSVIIFVAQVVFGVTFNIVLSIYEKLCVLSNFLCSIYYSIRAVLLAVSNFISSIVWSVHYLLCLVASAFLLLLQFIPDSFILIGKFVLFLLDEMVYTLRYSVLSVLNSLHVFRKSCETAVLNIPPKAYIGLTLLILFYYLSHKIIYYMKLCFCTFAYLFMCAYFISADWMDLFMSILSSWLSRVRWRRNRIAAQADALPGSSRAASSPQGFWVNFKRVKNIMKAFKRLEDGEELDESIACLQEELMREKDRRLCIVCQDHEREVMLLPCKHLCLCHDCCLQLKREFIGCPLCRRPIVDTINVYL